MRLFDTCVEWWNRELHKLQLDWLKSPEKLGVEAAVTGAFLGTFSHVAIDSILYLDMTPLSPWSNANELLGCISVIGVYIACVVGGVFGLTVWFIPKWRQKSGGS